jgi:hypothetical protein
MTRGPYRDRDDERFHVSDGRTCCIHPSRYIGYIGKSTFSLFLCEMNPYAYPIVWLSSPQGIVRSAPGEARGLHGSLSSGEIGIDRGDISSPTRSIYHSLWTLITPCRLRSGYRAGLTIIQTKNEIAVRLFFLDDSEKTPENCPFGAGDILSASIVRFQLFCILGSLDPYRGY